MKPNTRSLLLQAAFLPTARTVDNRAQFYLRKLDSITREPKPPAPPLPRWRVALECLAVWTVVLTAILWLVLRWIA